MYEKVNCTIYIITIIFVKNPMLMNLHQLSLLLKLKQPEEVYKYTLGDIALKWNAFKHSAKAQVGGAFKSARS